MEAFIQQVRAPSGTACHLLLRLVEIRGVEPLTSYMRSKRSTN